MSNRKSITDFKDLRNAIEEIQKNQPAQTRYQQQAEKMGYRQEAEKKKKKWKEPLKGYPGNEAVSADPKDDEKDGGLKAKPDHAGDAEIKKAYKELDPPASGSVENTRKLIQVQLKKMGYNTYSKFAFDSIFKLGGENNLTLESALDDMKDIVKTKGAKKVGGIMVDMFTASVITQAYDKVNDANKKKMEKSNVQTLVKLAQKVMGMKEEHNLDEGKMGDLFLDIQQGATAKDIARDYPVSLAQAKEFLKDYYSTKKGSRKESVNEVYPKKSKSGAEVAKMMMKSKTMKAFAVKVKKMKTVTADQLDKMLPDYVSGGDIGKMFEEVSREDKLKEERAHAKQSPFKLKSQQYPRAIAIDIKGHGKRHATELDITEACNSFGMITDQELQIEQIQKQLGKQGFISYTKSDLQDVFEDRETERMIYALESITEEQQPIEYTRDQIEDSYIMSEEVAFVKPDGQKTAGPVLKLCENTFNVKDKYTGKSFTYKYIEEGREKGPKQLTNPNKEVMVVKKNKVIVIDKKDQDKYLKQGWTLAEDNTNEENNVKTFREISEATFSAKLIKQAGGIAFDKRYYMGNMTGAIKAIEKLKKGLSDDPKVKALLRTANENTNNNFFEALSTEDKEAYQKFFNGALKKFGVSSPAELEGEKKKEFFDYVDKNWKGDNEKKEGVDEGKYEKYSDLLLKKARLVAQGPIAAKEVAAINKKIAAEMKKLGVKESPKRVDGRIKPFREKMAKLGYIKGPSFGK